MLALKLGIVNTESWAFFNEIYRDLQAHHETSLYAPRQVAAPLFQQRIERFVHKQYLQRFLASNQVVFFEWASGMLSAATQQPKTCRIIARLHRYELYQWAAHVDWQKVDRLIVVSEAKRREFTQRFPSQASKLVVIPEAIALDRFSYRQKDFTGQIGILCHLSPRKRVYELILAFHELLRRGNRLHLHIGGSGHSRYPDYEPALHALVETLKITDDVTFHGKITDPESWYSRIDVFVSNSYSEGLQVSPMEAIASGCLCVSHAWPGSNELLPQAQIFGSEADFITLIEAVYSAPPETVLGWQQAQLQRVRSRFDVEGIKVRIRELIGTVAQEDDRMKSS